jgi:probable HAF family extracellular repeat protein
VVGVSRNPNEQLDAFITGPDGVGMTDRGTLGEGLSTAYGINDAGQVVGFSSTAGGETHAFITGPNGAGMTDLASVVILPSGFTHFSMATAINNHGQLAVSAAVVPEPETYAMLLSGLGLIGFLARRRKTA